MMILTNTEQLTGYAPLRKIAEAYTPSVQNKSRNSTHTWVLAASLVALISAVVLVVQLQPAFEQLHAQRISTAWGTAIVWSGSILLAISTSFLAYITLLFFKYKPIEGVSNELLPTCTVIVPAYNEGSLVYKTLLSLVDNDYPSHKIQILAIDDGSKDDTWEWMKRAKNELGDRISVFQQPKNMGKRHALYRGINLATGDVIVTVDSDSIVKYDTLRNLVSPFVKDHTCGAVAGNVRVLNKKSMIAKMLNVSFVFSFEFVRSAQSALGSVFCTPGALAAYRKDAVMACLPQWINQTFMGQKSDIGEDRAMTNMILKQGYKVLFQRNALVWTNVPDAYKQLYKMYVRWERSNVRENIAMAKFAYTNFREGNKLGTRILLSYQWLRMLMAIPLTLLMVFLVLTHPILFISSALVGILIFTSVQVFFYGKKHNNIVEALWAYPYSLLFTFALFWITPYSIFTVKKNGWLTRTLPAKV
jgi:hyaluronan synthase